MQRILIRADENVNWLSTLESSLELPSKVEAYPKTQKFNEAYSLEKFLTCGTG